MNSIKMKIILIGVLENCQTFTILFNIAIGSKFFFYKKKFLIYEEIYF